jgi:hypothetical protein
MKDHVHHERYRPACSFREVLLPQRYALVHESQRDHSIELALVLEHEAKSGLTAPALGCELEIRKSPSE